MKRTGRTAVIVWLAALAAMAFIVARSQFTADMSAFLPQSPSASQQLLVEQLREGSLSRLLLIGIEGGADGAASRARYSNELVQRLAASGAFSAVQNGAGSTLERDREILFSYRYLLSPAVTPGRFSVDGLRQAIGDSIDLLASPAGLLIKNLLPRDPTGELMEILGALNAGGGPAIDHGVWASRDGSRAILMVQTAAAGSDIDAQEHAIERVRAEFADITRDDAKARLLLSGTPLFSVESRATIRSEVDRLAVVSALGIIAILLLVYRSATTLALSLLPVVSGVLAGIAAVSLGFGQVHGLTIGFGIPLIGEAVDYSVYYFVQSRKDADEEWRRQFWPTVRLGVLTSVCGFAALLLSGFPGLAQIGLFSISGLIAAAAVTRFVLPQLRPAGFRIRDTEALGRAFAPLLGSLSRLRGLATLLGVAALLIVATHHDRLWNTRLMDLSPISAEQMSLNQSLRSELGAPDQSYLAVVSAADRESALVAAERLSERLSGLAERGVIGGFETPARFLPSLATQQARRAALPARAELAERLDAALEGQPLQAEKLAAFLADVEVARNQPWLDVAALKGSALAMAVDAMLLRRPGGWSVLMPLRATADGSIDAAAVRAELAHEPGALFVDLGEETVRLYSDYLDEAILLSLAGFAAITLLLGFSLGSGQRLVRALVPLVLAVLLVMAGLAVVGERLNLLHLVGLLLIVAVGSNYTLFFDRDDALADARTLASLLVANAATVFAFGVLATSSVPVLHAIGVTVCPGTLLALLLAAMLARTSPPPERAEP